MEHSAQGATHRALGDGRCGGVLVVGLPVVTSPAAMAAPQTVTITSSGFVPRDVTVQVGETVTFSNADAAAHQVEFKGAGVTCPANPFVLQPGASGACTFTVAGNFAYSDPNKKGNTYRGTVTVTAPPGQAAAVTLATSRPLVVYGTKVSLTGKVNPVKGSVDCRPVGAALPGDGLREGLHDDDARATEATPSRFRRSCARSTGPSSSTVRPRPRALW